MRGYELTFSGPVEHAIAHIEEAAVHDMPPEQQRWYAIKIFERDDKALEKLNIPAGTMLHIESDIKAAEKELNDDSESIITNERYVCIAGIIKSCYSKKNAGALSISDTDIDCIDGRDGAYNSAACASKKNRASPAAGATAPTARCTAAAIHNKLKHTEYWYKPLRRRGFSPSP